MYNKIHYTVLYSDRAALLAQRRDLGQMEDILSVCVCFDLDDDFTIGKLTQSY